MRRLCAHEGLSPGATVPLERLAALSRVWYAGRLDEDWIPMGQTERQRVLAVHGLTGPFWAL